MSTYAKNCTSTIIPGLRYKDAKAMIEWLCNTLGFEKHAVYMGEGDRVMHAQLTFGSGMIMLGSADNPSPASKEMTLPAEIGGKVTQAAYLVVSDCDALYARIQAAGAPNLSPLEVMDYGGKAFRCHDPEGHLWHFGSYDPWESHDS